MIKLKLPSWIKSAKTDQPQNYKEAIAIINQLEEINKTIGCQNEVCEISNQNLSEALRQSRIEIRQLYAENLLLTEEISKYKEVFK